MNDANMIGILLFLHSRKELTVLEENQLLEWRMLSPENDQLYKEISDPEFVRRLMRDFYQERSDAFNRLKTEFPDYSDADRYEFLEGDAATAQVYEEARMNFPEKDIAESGKSKAEFWNTLLEDALFPRKETEPDGEKEENANMSTLKKIKRPGRLVRRLKRTAVGMAAIFLIAITLNSIFGDNDEPERFQASMGLPGKPVFKLTDFNRGFLEGWADITYGKTAKGERLRIFSEVKKAPKDATFYIVTYKRNESILQLPDGTILWMYPNSSIHFPAHFTGDTIHLGVMGKVYFESSSTKHLVITKDTSMQEYGDDKGLRPVPNEIRVEPSKAAFDITARYTDSTVSVNMLSGSALISLRGQPATNLQRIEAGKQITVGQTIQAPGPAADSSNILSLKNGEIYFKDASLKDVLYTVTQWYDVTIQYGEGVNPDQKVSLRVPLDSKLSVIIDSLTKQGFTVIKGGKTIRIEK